MEADGSASVERPRVQQGGGAEPEERERAEEAAEERRPPQPRDTTASDVRPQAEQADAGDETEQSGRAGPSRALALISVTAEDAAKPPRSSDEGADPEDWPAPGDWADPGGWADVTDVGENAGADWETDSSQPWGAGRPRAAGGGGATGALFDRVRGLVGGRPRRVDLLLVAIAALVALAAAGAVGRYLAARTPGPSTTRLVEPQSLTSSPSPSDAPSPPVSPTLSPGPPTPEAPFSRAPLAAPGHPRSGPRAPARPAPASPAPATPTPTSRHGDDDGSQMIILVPVPQPPPGTPPRRPTPHPPSSSPGPTFVPF
jgi:hypothetical protein